MGEVWFSDLGADTFLLAPSLSPFSLSLSFPFIATPYRASLPLPVPLLPSLTHFPYLPISNAFLPIPFPLRPLP